MIISCPTCGGRWNRARDGEGTKDADKMTAPTQSHIQILGSLLSELPRRQVTRSEIFGFVVKRYPNAKFMTIHSSISELVRKNVLTMTRTPQHIKMTDGSIRTKKIPTYVFNEAYGRFVYDNMEFI